jgi:riboflavin synthase
MFTGIVEELGTVRQVGGRMLVEASKVLRDSPPGSSIAVNGVCLTVVAVEQAAMAFDLSAETLARSSLGSLEPGDPVNLERPVTLLARLGGHIVQGHVDGVAAVGEIRRQEVGVDMIFDVPAELMRYLVEKGSVAVDGVSLTVAEMGRGSFGVALIPYTLEATNLGTKGRGDMVNIEVDVLAKYVEALVRRTA